MRGNDKLTILRFLNRGRDDNLGFFDSSFLEFQETRELRVERQRRGNGRDIENTKTYSSWPPET